jgi:5-formyltetrahydrofolate cyclo-ligase
MTVVTDLKQVARKYAIARRKRAHDVAHLRVRDGHSEGEGSITAQACELLVHFLSAQSGHVVAGYMPIRSEIDPRPALAALGQDASQRWTLALPIVEAPAQPLRFDRWQADDPLQEGAYGARIPAHSQPIVPDIIIVPLVAFNREGHRLGYGGGYYDRTLEKLRRTKQVLAVGFAYGGQEMSDFPVGPKDAPLDAIVTEQEIVTF